MEKPVNQATIFRPLNGPTSMPETCASRNPESPSTSRTFVSLPSGEYESQTATKTSGQRTARQGISRSQRAAIERGLTSYISLQCGHYTTVREQELYRPHRARRKYHR